MANDKSNGVPQTPSPEGTEQVEGKESKGKRAYNSPKTSKEVLLKCRYDYDRGNWTSLKELGERYGIDQRTLQGRITREKWDKQRQVILSKVESKVEKEVLREVSEQESYLKRSYLRSQRYEKLIDASLSQLATTPEGVPMAEPADIDTLTRSEMRIAELSRIALRIPVLSALDITSGGQDLGTSFVQAIQKLRQSETPKLEASDLGRVLEAEIE